MDPDARDGPEPPLDRDRPLHEQVGERLRGAIAAGRLPEGSFLPPEPALCARYGVSRVTLRRAVTDLCAAGLLMRQQGRGTLVAGNKVRQELVSLSGFSDLFDGPEHAVEHRVLSRGDAVPPAATRALGAAGPPDIVLRLILVGGRPLTLERLALAPAVPADVAAAVAGGASLLRSLRDLHGIEPAAADRLIEAGFPSPEERRALGLGAARPVFRVTKTTHGPGGPLAWSHLVTPADRVAFALRTGAPETRP